MVSFAFADKSATFGAFKNAVVSVAEMNGGHVQITNHGKFIEVFLVGSPIFKRNVRTYIFDYLFIHNLGIEVKVKE